MRGKPAVIVFVTTGDIVGRPASYLVHMAKNDGDRVFYAMVAVHPRKEAILVETYKQTLGVDFPVALADAAVASDRDRSARSRPCPPSSSSTASVEWSETHRSREERRASWPHARALIVKRSAVPALAASAALLGCKGGQARSLRTAAEEARRGASCDRLASELTAFGEVLGSPPRTRRSA